MSNYLFMSYLQRNGTVQTGIINDISGTISFVQLPSAKNNYLDYIFTDQKVKNYDPNNISDPYRVSENPNYKFVYDHTIDDRLGPISVITDGYLDIILSTHFGGISSNIITYTDTSDISIINQNIYNYDTTWNNLTYNENVAIFPCDSGFAYYCRKTPGSDKIEEIFFHDNYYSSLGSTCYIAEDLYDHRLAIVNTGSSNVAQTEVRKLVDLDIRYTYNNTDFLDHTNESYQYEGTSYSGLYIWNDSKFKDIRGSSLADLGYSLTGNITEKLIYKKIGCIVNQKIYNNIGATLTSPTETGYFYDTTIANIISGYYNKSIASLNIPTDDYNFIRSYLEWNDGTNDKSLDVSKVSVLKFDTQAKDLVGKKCKINSYFNTIAGEAIMASNSIVPVYNQYYDIKDITLTMSGFKADSVLGNVGYEQIYLKEASEAILFDKKEPFASNGIIELVAEITVSPNTTTLEGEKIIYNPYPSGIWLIAVPKSALTYTDVQSITVLNTFLKVSELNILENRNITSEKSKYPKIKSSAAEEMILLCTGTANTINSYGIIWNKIEYDNPGCPEDGTFPGENYTIKVTIPKGSWLPFLIIGDTELYNRINYTCYCIKNSDNYDVPTGLSF